METTIIIILKKILVDGHPLTTIELSNQPPVIVIFNDYILNRRCTGNLKLIDLLKDIPYKISSDGDWLKFYEKAEEVLL